MPVQTQPQLEELLDALRIDTDRLRALYQSRRLTHHRSSAVVDRLRKITIDVDQDWETMERKLTRTHDPHL